MKIRELRREDSDRLKEIIESNGPDFRVPSFKYPIVEGVVTQNEEVIGYGLTRYFSEALIVLDQNLSNYDKAKAILTLFKPCIAAAKREELDELNVFVSDPEYAELLIKHFGFVQFPGISLTKDLTNG